MKKSKEKSTNLIICTTPLQIIIAEAIVNLYPSETFDLIVVTSSDNTKYRYYYDRLSQLCHNYLFYKNRESIVDFLQFITVLKLTKKIHMKYENIYLASIDSRYIQYVVSKNHEAKVFTFDDGTANILPNTIYSEEIIPAFFKRSIWRLLGIKYYMNDIKELSLLHYTIYKDIPNIITNTQFIELGNKPQNSGCYEITDTKKFYLGQPLNEVSKTYDLKYMEKIVDILDVDFYYPHPRETIIPDGSFKVINSNLIFEDYVITYLNDNPNTKIYVYSFTSSCILNIANLDRVEPIYIFDDYFNLRFSELYKLANERLNISLMHIL